MGKLVLACDFVERHSPTLF